MKTRWTLLATKLLVAYCRTSDETTGLGPPFSASYSGPTPGTTNLLLLGILLENVDARYR